MTVEDAWCDADGDAYRCTCESPLLRRPDTDVGDCPACGLAWRVLPGDTGCGDVLVQQVPS